MTASSTPINGDAHPPGDNPPSGNSPATSGLANGNVLGLKTNNNSIHDMKLKISVPMTTSGAINPTPFVKAILENVPKVDENAVLISANGNESPIVKPDDVPTDDKLTAYATDLQSVAKRKQLVFFIILRTSLSFSGIKTGVNRYIQTTGIGDSDHIQDIAAGFQEAVVDVLSYKLLHAAQQKKCDHAAIVGGVAANTRLRAKVLDEAAQKGLKVHIPSPDLCGDNAAMIAAVGFHYLSQGMTSDLSSDVYSRVKN